MRKNQNFEITYHINETIEDTKRILQNEFEMKEISADLLILINITEKHTNFGDRDTSEGLWDLIDQKRFSTPIFKSRISISFTEIQKDIVNEFVGLILSAFAYGNENNGEIEFKKLVSNLMLNLVLACLQSLIKNSTYIKPNECCVYYQALNWVAAHPHQNIFTVEDILPKPKDKICEHLDLIRNHRWICRSCHEEFCGATKSSFTTSLNQMCERHVFSGDDVHGFKFTE